MRLVVIDTKRNLYTVQEGKTPLAVFAATPGSHIGPEEVEELRVMHIEPEAA